MTQPLRKEQPAEETAPAAPSWWVGKSREEFSAAARQEFAERLSLQRLPRSLFPNQRLVIPK